MNGLEVHVGFLVIVEQRRLERLEEEKEVD